MINPNKQIPANTLAKAVSISKIDKIITIINSITFTIINTGTQKGILGSEKYPLFKIGIFFNLSPYRFVLYL